MKHLLHEKISVFSPKSSKFRLWFSLAIPVTTQWKDNLFAWCLFGFTSKNNIAQNINTREHLNVLSAGELFCDENNLWRRRASEKASLRSISFRLGVELVLGYQGC